MSISESDRIGIRRRVQKIVGRFGYVYYALKDPITDKEDIEDIVEEVLQAEAHIRRLERSLKDILISKDMEVPNEWREDHGT